VNKTGGDNPSNLLVWNWRGHWSLVSIRSLGQLQNLADISEPQNIEYVFLYFLLWM